MHSLRPYLEPNGAKFYLRFSRSHQDPSVQEESRPPFLVINESDPVARLIEAQLVTDAGSEIKRVFVLLQNDKYLLPKDELRPVNNKDIEQWWQTAFSFYSSKKQNSAVVVLADQVSEEGRLSPLQSLFFCKPKQIFFHPPCPRCGLSLQQCYDDELLVGNGLQPYSTSLKRYLFCRSCMDSGGKSDFYVFSLESSDPPVLKDRWDLIREWALLAEDKNHLPQFPCPGCAKRHECWATDALAVSRIAPFSFYPFFVLIFEAMSVNAVDFLSLVSGASFEDVEGDLIEKQEAGRISCLKALRGNGSVRTPFFFDSDERYFLEVLYLKLSFLGELVRTVLPRLDTHQYHGTGLPIDRVWVKLGDQGSLLPFLWNFRLNLINIAGNVAGTPLFPKLALSRARQFLGLVWFYALLVNKSQSVSEVYASLGEAIEQITSSEATTLDSLLNSGLNRALSPENIFWNPQGGIAVKNGRDLWEESMRLGWSLLEVSSGQDFQWSQDEFLQEIEGLRKEIKGTLFQQSPAAGRGEPPPENKAIHHVLTRIINKWREDFEAEKEDLEKTVILSTEAPKGLEETVVLSAQEAEEEVTQETVILPHEDFGKDGSLPGRVEEDDIPETVVIAPPEKIETLPRSSEGLPPTQEELEEAGDSKKGTGASASDDFLAETVILRPGKTKDEG